MMRARRVSLGVVFLSLSASAVAHHSYTEFDNTQSTEIDGILLNIAWQNPHALIEVQAAGPNGDLVTIGLQFFRPAR